MGRSSLKANPWERILGRLEKAWETVGCEIEKREQSDLRKGPESHLGVFKNFTDIFA